MRSLHGRAHQRPAVRAYKKYHALAGKKHLCEMCQHDGALGTRIDDSRMHAAPQRPMHDVFGIPALAHAGASGGQVGPLQKRDPAALGGWLVDLHTGVSRQLRTREEAGPWGESSLMGMAR